MAPMFIQLGIPLSKLCNPALTPICVGWWEVQWEQLFSILALTFHSYLKILKYVDGDGVIGSTDLIPLYVVKIGWEQSGVDAKLSDCWELEKNLANISVLKTQPRGQKSHSAEGIAVMLKINEDC